MRNLSVGKLTDDRAGIEVSADESVSAMLFDLCGWKGSLDDYPPAAENFGQGKALKISSLEDAEEAGITPGILYGIPYYHIKCFFDLAGENAQVYVALADCSAKNRAACDNSDESDASKSSNESDASKESAACDDSSASDANKNLAGNDAAADFCILDDIARLSGYTVFQIGIWTEQPVWVSESDGAVYSLSPFIIALAEKLQQMSAVAVSDVSAIVFGGIGEGCAADTNLAELPDLTTLRQPRLSVVLGQPSDDKVHEMQLSTARLTPPGMTGRVIALLTLLPAEESIANVMTGDLNKAEDIEDAEIGMGKIDTDENYFTPIGDIADDVYASLLAKGYIVPIRYDGIETGFYLAADTTATNGEVNTISLARVLRKAKRIVMQALMPYINADWHSENGGLSKAARAQINGAMSESLAARLLCADKGTLQAESIKITVDPSTTLLSDDGITLKFAIIPLGQEKEIHLRERSEFPIDN